MAGLAMNVFGVFYWLIDVKGYERWAKPFAIYGMNAITVFMLAGITGRLSLEIKLSNLGSDPIALKSLLYRQYFAHISSDPKIASLTWAITYVVILYLVAYLMYRRKWFLRV